MYISFNFLLSYPADSPFLFFLLALLLDLYLNKIGILNYFMIEIKLLKISN